MNKPKVIVLTGPTGVGKTNLSILLAKHINGEIISADSMQVYKHMDIGTAKITREEMLGIPHHMIDILEPTEDFDVFMFKSMAKELIYDINRRGKIPVLVGGTGFYIQALIYDIDFSDKINNEYRKSLENTSIDRLYEMLVKVDNQYAKTVDKNNKKRVIPALEFYKTTGKKLSLHNKIEREKPSPYDCKYFVLTKNRENLYRDIDKRVDTMIKKGLLDEVKNLESIGVNTSVNSGKAIGYKEIFEYITGELSLDEAINKIKQNTRHFAKRQLTWFRREKNVIWVNKEDFTEETQALEFILEKINE